MTRQVHEERPYASTNGYPMVAVGLGLIATGAWLLFRTVLPGVLGGQDSSTVSAFGAALSGLLGVLVCVGLIVVGIFWLTGLYMLQPNTAALLSLFGAYRGTDRTEGLRWANPLLVKRSISLRARNLNMPTLKVNDKRGNPVEIAAAVVWQVDDTAQAIYEVDDYERYVGVQAETALRHMASRYAYDSGDSEAAGAATEPTLRGSIDEVAQALMAELQERLAAAGVVVRDAKLTHLAYAPEIAQVMLRRQQAEAIISARSKIVLGAVTMVESALKGLSERAIVELDDERKAAMVSNLLVVLCSDKDAQPIINTGTLYN